MKSPTPVLRFSFVGYSIWLEPEQFHGDLDQAMQQASNDLGCFPIPAVHATAIYGMTHLSESRAKELFLKMAWTVRSWPRLKQTGFLADVEFSDGMEGGMDMAWMEVTYETSEEHEKLLDYLHECFYCKQDQMDNKEGRIPRKPWLPHVSLAYHEPERPISQEYVLRLVKHYPTLARHRNLKAISLWRTQGTIDKWKCLERIPFLGEELEENSDTDDDREGLGWI